MDFNEIMQKITSELTGNQEKDAAYLIAQMGKYKDHEMSKEILRACGRLLYQCLPEDQKAEWIQAHDNSQISYESVMEEARFKQHEKKYDEACNLMESLIRKIETVKLFQDDQVSEYHCFNEFFEEALYRLYKKPVKEIRQASVPFDTIYFQYGSILIDLKRYKEAETALITAMRWNPADVRIAFERMEACKQQGNLEGFFQLTQAAFKYAFRPQQVARCFRNLGYYFIEKQLWDAAMSCYTLSLHYEKESTMAMSELYYIQQKAGKVMPPSGLDEIKELGEKYKFPVGPDRDVLGLSFSYGKRFADNGDTAGARYCWKITYDLTEDERIKQMLELLPTEERTES